MLLGIAFSSPTFGYTYGTGGTLLITEDGGNLWTPHKVGAETILQASISRVGYGLIRTRTGVFYLNGSDIPNPVVAPPGILQRFSFVPSLVALTDQKMGVFLSEGAFAEGGYLTTTDGGKSWKFYDPPNTGILSFLAVDGKYWASGHEVVGKDKPGGGYGVPMAAYSDDGEHWTHVPDDIRPCHWENCGVCTPSGCLASGSLLVNFFRSPVRFASIPKGPLTAKWASITGIVCSIEDGVNCAHLGEPKDLISAPETPKPSEQGFGSLNNKPPAGGTLRCISCSLGPVYIDDKVQGRYKVQITLLVRTDGTMEQATIQNAPSESVSGKMQVQLMQWLFEPPVKDGKPIKVKSQSEANITVVRPR